MRSSLTSRPVSLETLLDREQATLDQIMAEVRADVRTPAQFDDLEERAVAVAKGLRAAFRNCSRSYG